METEGYIKRFMPLWEGWKLDKFLGSGSYGNVWQVIHEAVSDSESVKEKEVAAIKEVIVPSPTAGTIEMACLQGLNLENARLYFAGALKETIAEANMQQTLSNCCNIVQFRDYQIKTLDQQDEFGWAFYILMDKVKAFPEYLMENGITVSKVIQLGIDLCHALERCQKSGIIHRDIKPENIFYCPQKNCFQLGDFGIARYLVRPTANKGRPGTLTHMSPEVYQGADFSYEDDLYAVGMILYKLLNYNRIPLLPDYPQQYMPNQRDEALICRLKGALLPLPALTRLQPEQISEANRIRAGVRLDMNDLNRIQILGSIAQKAIS
ncbi:MAG: protein kinase, partial [Oscillospiraceae bacterium]|nr:protein kinase [Oscillospiraceae bacterium]